MWQEMGDVPGVQPGGELAKVGAQVRPPGVGGVASRYGSGHLSSLGDDLPG